jgi:carboxylesterase type B
MILKCAYYRAKVLEPFQSVIFLNTCKSTEFYRFFTFSGLHLHSPLSKGLFQYAICESGSSLNYWAVSNKETIRSSKKVASLLGCSSSNHSSQTQSMLDCLRTKNPNWIVGQSLNAWKIVLFTRFAFGPVIEAQSPTAFLTESPKNMYQTQNVQAIPLLIGINRDEGVPFAAGLYLFPGHLQQINAKWNSLLPYVLTIEGRSKDDAKIAKQLQNHYLNGDTMTFWNRKGWTDVSLHFYEICHHFKRMCLINSTTY